MGIAKENFVLGVSSLALLLCAPQAFAQTTEVSADPDEYFEVIVVTAQKRSENLQDVPQAVTAVTSETLTRNNISDFVGLSGYVPGLTVSPAEGGDRVTISIRGVGQEANQNDVASPSVSFHSDGVYIVSPFALGASFINADRLEVVRGPQGTLFGQNSTGGAINVITKQPVLGEWFGDVSASYGTFEYANVTGDLNIPIGETFAIRAAVSRLVQEGSTTNIFNGQKLDDRDNIGWRVKALWQPTDSFKVTLTAEEYASETNGAARFGLLDPTSGRRRLSQDDPSHLDLESSLYSIVTEWTLPFVTIKYLGSYQKAVIDRSRDNDFTSVNLVSPLVLRRSYEQTQDQDHTSYTSEINLVSNERLFGKLDWVLGAFWFDQEIEAETFERVDQNRNGVLNPFTEAPNLAVFGIPPFGADVGFQSNFFPSRTSYSVYGQGTFHASDALRFTGGLRYTEDTAENLNYNFFNIQRNRPTASITNVSQGLTGRLAVEYDFDSKKLGYASYTRGFKPGGNNLTFGRLDAAEDRVFASFESEVIDAYEIGLKADLFNGRLRSNVSSFMYQYENLQAQGTDPRNVASGVINVPKSEVLGLETELQWAPTNNLTVSGSVTALKSEITESFLALDGVKAAAAEYNLVVVQKVNQLADSVTLARAAVIEDVKGNELSKTPPLSATLTTEYVGTVAEGIEGVASVTVKYRDAMQTRIFNNPAVDRIPSYLQVNTFMALKYDTGLELNLTIQNLLDEDSVASRFTDTFGVYSTFDQLVPPRTIIARVKKSF